MTEEDRRVKERESHGLGDVEVRHWGKREHKVGITEKDTE